MKKLYVSAALVGLLLSGCGSNSNSTEVKQVVQSDLVKSYNIAEVQSHNSKNSCWSVIDDQVYDLTLYVSSHPGGADKIESICGKDGSADFHGQHGQRPQMKFILAAFKIGDLSK